MQVKAMRGATALAVVMAVPMLATAAAAGGCGAVECYAKVKHPDVYQTVARPVVLAPARQDVVTTPAMIGHQVNRVEVMPGRWHAHHEPAMYGTRAKVVQVAPAKVHYSVTAPVYQTVHQNVVVQPGSYRWEHKHGLFGHDKLCKVYTPAVTQTVARTVMVAPAQKVAHVTPASYRTVTQPVLLRPAATRHVYQPPVHDFVSTPVVVRPATQQVVTHPAVVGVEHSNVLVQQGGHSWQRTHTWFH